MSMFAMVLCWVGMFLVLPISYGALAIAYEQVFGFAHVREPSYMPPPPPLFND